MSSSNAEDGSGWWERDRERLNERLAEYVTGHNLYRDGGSNVPPEDAADDVRRASMTRCGEGRQPLCTRTFVAGPDFARGMSFPTIESELVGGRLNQDPGWQRRACVPFDRAVTPLNRGLRKFLARGAHATLPWTDLAGQSARDQGAGVLQRR